MGELHWEQNAFMVGAFSVKPREAEGYSENLNIGRFLYGEDGYEVPKRAGLKGACENQGSTI